MAKAKKAAPAKATRATTTRDREATEQRFIEAAARVIARDGAVGLGVNAIAAEAGADKKLIYRYFGGLDGLLEKMGATTALWIGELAPALKGADDYSARMLSAFTAYAEKLRGDPVLQKLLAWELAGPTDTLRTIDAARSKAMGKMMFAIRGDAAPPAGVDAPAVNAIVLAALNYLVIRGETMGGFAGMKLESDADWKRTIDALRGMLGAVYRV